MATYYVAGKRVTKTEFRRLTAKTGSGYAALKPEYKERSRKKEEEEKKSLSKEFTSAGRPSSDVLYPEQKRQQPTPTIKSFKPKESLYVELGDERVKTTPTVKKTIYTSENGVFKPTDYEISAETKQQLETGGYQPETQTKTVLQARTEQRPKLQPYKEKSRGGFSKAKDVFKSIDAKLGITGKSQIIKDIEKKRGITIQSGIAPAVGLKSFASGFNTLRSVYNVVKGTKAGLWTINAIKGYVGGKAIVFGSKQSAKVGLTPEEKTVLSSRTVQQAIGQAYFKESEAIKEQGFFRNLGYQLSPIFSNKKSVFEKELDKQLYNQGLLPEEISKAKALARRQRKFTTGGEAAALLYESFTSERTGRALSSMVLKDAVIPANKAGRTLFKKTFIPIASAGFIEGFTQETSQQAARNQRQNFKEAAKMGLYGFGSAGIIGGGIVGLSVNKKTTSKLLNFAANISDLFEKPGDILADVVSKGERKLGFKGLPEPVVTITGFTKTPVNPFTTSKTKGKSGVFTTVKTPSTTQTTSMTQTLKNAVGIPTTTKTPTTVKTPVNINLREITGINTPIVTNTNTEIPTDIVTTTLTPVTNINIPTATPLLRLPPPSPSKLRNKIG